MEPVWTELAKSVDESGDTVIASVDCKANKDLCKKYEVSSRTNESDFAVDHLYGYGV